jgi:2,4-dienoyl-CoA reductase-like NADH-dependent reductase (Old Yellow Enzyme family)
MEKRYFCIKKGNRTLHEIFNIKTLDELREKISHHGVGIELTEDLSPLGRKVTVGGKVAPNAIAVLPMEGCDFTPDGSPTGLVERRYLRFASGGAGLLWWEACSVVPEGRANPLQMMLTKDNVGQVAKLLTKSNHAAANANGSDHRPVNILQLTHSGRYSRPTNHNFEPITVQRDPLLDPRAGLNENSPVATDMYLESLVEHYVTCSKLARDAGFDGVDIKACHRYLLSELLASFNREGKYGGSFENRSRLLRDIVLEVKKEMGDDFIVACRFNTFDAHPYPYGFGSDKDDFTRFDPTESLALVRTLCDSGVGLLGNSAGNPYYIYPQMTRPFDTPSIGTPVPQEHPLKSVARLFATTNNMQAAAGNQAVVTHGYGSLFRMLLRRI